MRPIIATLASAVALSFGVTIASADPVADFYKGKRITFIVPTAPGGSYHAYGLQITRHMGKHVPGHPTLVLQNMPGAGAIVAMNYLYNVAPKDGTTIAIIARALPTAPLLYGEESKAQFEATKFNWLGSLVKEMGMGAVSRKAPATTLADMRKTEIILGASGPESDPAMYARLFNQLYGTKFKVIAAYSGQIETLHAVEKGEIHGLFLSGWSGSGRAFVKDKVAAGEWATFVQMGLDKDPAHAETPTIMEVITNPQDQAVLRFLFGRQILGQPFALPPDVPADRVAMMRDAFRKAVDDPGMREELERQRFALSPVYGEDAQRIMGELYATPPEVIKRAQALVKSKQ